MPDSKEQLKRQNYFDLKRDEWMAMDEYLLSPISEMDLRRMNEGGIANIENMTAPIGMAGGGDWNDQLELEIIKLESIIKGLMEDEVLTGVDNSKAIQGHQNWLDYYRSLR